MRKIYRIRSSQGRSIAVKIALVVAVVAVTGLATLTHPVSDAVSRTEARPLPASAGAAPPYYYFPSQYELHAGPPEPHVEAF
jgi:hypothetical protein